MTRPNILYIFTDQQSASAMSCAGNGDLKTPALDSLAAAGTRFTNAYCSFPLCLPARVSMFTGKMPHELDIHGNSGAIPETLRASELGNLLRHVGYDCAYGGKWHAPEIAMKDESHGFTPICGFNDTQLADACVAFLKQKRDKPFFLVASFDNPHNICEWARQQSLPWGDVADVPMAQCPGLPSNYAVAPFAPQALDRERQANHAVHPTTAFTDDHWRHFRHAYFRLVEKVDGQIGRILAALKRYRLDDETVVIFSSDHGDGHGAHHWNQKSAFFEEVTNIPLIIRGARRSGKERVSDALASNCLDLLPTVCDYAGAPVPKGLHGRSLRPHVEGKRVARWRSEVVCETNFPAGNYKGTQGRMIRTQRYKYCIYSWGLYREQLHDMELDRGEMVNLAVEARCSDILEDHRRRLGRWCEKTNDYFIKTSGGRLLVES